MWLRVERRKLAVVWCGIMVGDNGRYESWKVSEEAE